MSFFRKIFIFDNIIICESETLWISFWKTTELRFHKK